MFQAQEQFPLALTEYYHCVREKRETAWWKSNANYSIFTATSIHGQSEWLLIVYSVCTCACAREMQSCLFTSAFLCATAIESLSERVCASALYWDVFRDTREFETSLQIFPLHFTWTKKEHCVSIKEEFCVSIYPVVHLRELVPFFHLIQLSLYLRTQPCAHICALTSASFTASDELFQEFIKNLSYLSLSLSLPILLQGSFIPLPSLPPLFFCLLMCDSFIVSLFLEVSCSSVFVSYQAVYISFLFNPHPFLPSFQFLFKKSILKNKNKKTLRLFYLNTFTNEV